SAVTLVAGIALFSYFYVSYSALVDKQLAAGYLASRAGIYAAPRVLRQGSAISRDELVMALKRAGYLENNASDIWNGGFTAGENAVELRPRRTEGAPQVVRVGFGGGNRIATLTSEGAALGSYALEPELLTSDLSMKTSQRAALAYGDIPPTLVRAIISIEDRRFFAHHGVDISGIARALLRNTGDRNVVQGGSTITQQLVKNTYLTPERTFRRKFNEAVLSTVLERKLSKEDIFALYCNEIYLGQRGSAAVRGVAQAARVYFGKELRDLTLGEAATIAGMIQSPNRHAPDRHPEAAAQRRNAVLTAMARDGAITPEDAEKTSREELHIASTEHIQNATAPYFIDYVNRSVESEMEVSNRSDARDLRIYTTINLDLQQLAEKVVAERLEKLARVYKNKGVTPQAALVAMDPHTGHVLAMVGGRDYADSQLNRATDARRQPGSVFKPIVYSAALESGISPLSLFNDSPRAFIYDRKKQYRPANYGGGYSMHDVTMRTALTRSLNVVTVDLALRTGLSRIANLAENFGLPKPEPYPALALGTTEATPLEMASAYTAFANDGKAVNSVIITSAVDSTGNALVKQIAPESRRVIRPETAYVMTDMMSAVVERGTARAARGSVKRTAIAGKTGTSRDGWFVGYTPNLVCAVWVGLDDNGQLGLTGAEAALPAWVDFVKGAVNLQPELGGESFLRPAGVTTVEIDPETGMLATPSCPRHERIAISTGFAPPYPCLMHNQPLPLVASLDTEIIADPTLAPAMPPVTANGEAKINVELSPEETSGGSAT
ncbi:MAG TPA: PBP1A family penicillin-binding protein, partial [Pyrinomonadaceae bacterium]|nr:PBP1A family penicillin-binding protein [Pyrinomonadaceae bacterium]